MSAKDIVNQLLTGKDGYTHDVVRWLAVLCVVEALALVAYAVIWRGQAFDLQAFGIGCGALFVSVGAALKLKSDTEPDPKDKP